MEIPFWAPHSRDFAQLICTVVTDGCLSVFEAVGKVSDWSTLMYFQCSQSWWPGFSLFYQNLRIIVSRRGPVGLWHRQSHRLLQNLDLAPAYICAVLIRSHRVHLTEIWPREVAVLTSTVWIHITNCTSHGWSHWLVSGAYVHQDQVHTGQCKVCKGYG